MSPDTIEAVRCALQTVCETGGTMDEIALIEQADRIAELEEQLVVLHDFIFSEHGRKFHATHCTPGKCEQSCSWYVEPPKEGSGDE